MSQSNKTELSEQLIRQCNNQFYTCLYKVSQLLKQTTNHNNNNKSQQNNKAKQNKKQIKNRYKTKTKQ